MIRLSSLPRLPRGAELKLLGISALALLLVLTGLWNARINETKTLPASAPNSQQTMRGAIASLEDFRKERELTRRDELAQLDQIIESGKTQEETRRQAQQQKLTLLTFMETETTLEGVLAASGFAESVVTVGKSSVNVLVPRAELKKEEAVAIFELASRETGHDPGDIKVIPVQTSAEK